MGRFVLVCLGLVSLSCGTSPAFMSRRLDDGSYRLQCKTSLAQCLDRVEEVCGSTPYDVVSAHDERRPVDIMVGSYQREVRSSEATVRCTRDKPLFGAGPDEPAPAAAGLVGVPAPPPPPAQPRACVPGATQACVGAGACSGGQACLVDGSGFGACNCAPQSQRGDAGTN